VGWAARVACTGWKRKHTMFWFENLKGRENSKNLGVDERIMLK
jgi:hypothetical protein